MPKKTRLRADELICAQGLAESKNHAASLIMADRVVLLLDEGREIKVLKPGQLLDDNSRFRILTGKIWASRGALKLLTIMDFCQIDVNGQVCIDAGASTGGFTDCLLSRGAKKVYAIDVGKNLLHEKLQEDPRVCSLERINLRIPNPFLLPELADFLAADLSFISLTLCIPTFLPWLAQDAKLALLVKPQFELPRTALIKGIVKDPSLREKALLKVINFCEHECGLKLLHSMPSSIKGAKGNQEYLALFQK